jgi:hypothetical protein
LSHAGAGDLYLRMKKPAKQTKLPFHPETIRQLPTEQLGQAIGGQDSSISLRRPSANC